jgi:hypothetical protein
MVDISGKEKIINYINRYKVKKIRLSRGTDVVYMKQIKVDENQSDLVDDFATWIDDFIDENNFKEYKLELLGTNNTDPDARLSTIVKISVSFGLKPNEIVRSISGHNNAPIKIDDYVSMAVQNAELKAQLGAMESKLDELLTDDDDDDENDTMGTIKDVFLSKIDGIIDVLIHQFGSRNTNPSQGIAGTEIDESDIELDKLHALYYEFRVINPQILHDLRKLLEIAKEKPSVFNMLIQQLRNF